MKPVLVSLFFMLALSVLSEGQNTGTVKVADGDTKNQPDSLEIASLLSNAYKWLLAGEADSAVAAASHAAELASASGQYFSEGKAYEIIGKAEDLQKNWDGTMLWLLKAVSVFDKNNYKIEEAGLLNIIGSKYLEKGIYSKAAEYFISENRKRAGDSDPAVALSAEKAAYSLFMTGNDSLAAFWYTRAIEFFNTAGGLPQETERCRRKLITVYTRLGEYVTAESLLLSEIESEETRGNKINEASLRNELGYILFRKGNTNEALQSFQKASEKAQDAENADTLLTDIYTNIGICLQNLGLEKDMIAAFRRSLRHAEAAKLNAETARLSHILAVISFRKKDLYHAELYCLDCIEAARQSSNHSILSECFKTYSDVLESGNDFVSALGYYEKYLSTRDSIALENRLSAQKESELIKSYEDEEQAIKNSITTDEIRGLEIRNLRAESARRENEMKLLMKQQELDKSERSLLLNSLALEKEKNIARENETKVKELERDKAMQQLDLENKTQKEAALQAQNRMLEQEKDQQILRAEKEKQIRILVIWLTVLMIIVAFGILAGLISTRRKNQKLADSKKKIEEINQNLEARNREVLSQNEKILAQKEIIEQKNQSITDSIQYASRIQNAVFPPLNFLAEFGLDNFIFFRPKDIVSGDFYWGAARGGRVLVAAADCTGHGVPGAFMSMLGHSFLDEIINTTEINDAAQVLNLLRDGIITTLRQKGTVGETRDGMDISLCIIDRNKGTLDYSGANNPLYLIQEGKLIKLNADKMPIGIHVTEQTPFTNHSVKIAKGDHIYLFSDGYADQFGGQKGKKFMYKPFQELLLRNCQKPMDVQHDILENTFLKWMGGHDQVDDVMVIGIKI